MFPQQTTFESKMDGRLYPGQVSGMKPLTVRKGFRNAALVDIRPGILVCRSATDSQAFVAATTGASVAGFTTSEQIYAQSATPGAPFTPLPLNRFHALLKEGSIGVTVEAAVTPTSKVYVRVVAGAFPAGSITGTADGANTVELTGCSFEQAGAAGEVVELYIKHLPTIL